MGPKLVDYLLYEPEPSGILWIKFNRPERMNALVGTAEDNSTVAKAVSYTHLALQQQQAAALGQRTRQRRGPGFGRRDEIARPGITGEANTASEAGA